MLTSVFPLCTPCFCPTSMAILTLELVTTFLSFSLASSSSSNFLSPPFSIKTSSDSTLHSLIRPVIPRCINNTWVCSIFGCFNRIQKYLPCLPTDTIILFNNLLLIELAVISGSSAIFIAGQSRRSIGKSTLLILHPRTFLLSIAQTCATYKKKRRRKSLVSRHLSNFKSYVQQTPLSPHYLKKKKNSYL